jgi:proteasome lid subunit RPN8/RPN11
MIEIPAEFREFIAAEGEKAYPNECCGFLFGALGEDGDRFVCAARPAQDAREDGEQYHRFRIEPEDFMRAELESRLAGQDILGFYHSHPDHPAAPSDYDREHALPFYSYVIVSVQNGGAAAMTSWLLAADRSAFDEEPVK